MFNRRNRSVVSKATVAGLEQLEKRVLFSTINWTNKGTTVVDSDGFNATYGANATLARNIVQRAIDDWERVIVDFNYSGGGNTFNLDVSAASLGPGLRGTYGGITYDANDLPTSADITLDNDGGGGGWYFDPHPGTASVPDDSEYNNLVSPFTADDTAAGNDLYRTTSHAIGASVGLLISSSAAIDNFMTDTGIDDPNDAGTATLRTVNFGSGVVATFTESDGGNLYEGPTRPGISIVHPDDLMNAGRTIPVGINRRQLISDIDATILRDAYGYSIALPSQLNTFYANLDTVSNTVTITGDANPDGSDDDVIDLEVNGSAMSFEVNGTDELIDGAQFTSILVSALGGNDDVDVDGMLSGKPVTINGANGNDRLDVAQGTDDVDSNVFSNLTFNGGTDTDTLAFHDTLDGPSANVWSFTKTTATKSSVVVAYSLTETIVVNASAQDNAFTIDGISAALTIHGGAGNESFNVADGDIDSNLDANLTLEGSGGTDSITFNDTADGANSDVYELTDTRLTKAPNGSNRRVDFTGMESFVLNGSNQPNRYDIVGVVSNMPATFIGGSGDDTFNFAAGDIEDDIASNVTVTGNGGADVLNFDDSTDDFGQDTYTVQQNVFTKSLREFNYSVEAINLTGSPQDDTFDLLGTAAGTFITLNSAGGGDTFNLGTGDLGSVLSGLVLNGQGGTDALVINDLNDIEDDTYTITDNTFAKTFVNGNTRQFAQYAGMESLSLDANGASNTIDITSAGSATPLTVRGNGGDDTFRVGSPGNNADAVLAAVSLRGGAGNDAIPYNDALNTLAHAYTITSTLLSRSGAGPVDYAGMETLTLNAGLASDTVDVNSTLAATPVTINGGGSADVITVGGGDWDANLLSSVIINGGLGVNDSLRIDDTTDAVVPADDYTVSATQTTKTSTAVTITYSTVEGYTLDANGAANVITVNDSFAAPFRINANGGADTVNLVSSAAGSFVTIDGGAGLDFVNVNSDALGTAVAHFDSSQDLANLNLPAGATAVLEINGNRLIDTDGLTIASTSKLDLTDNDLILDYTAATQLGIVQALINIGRNNGLWNGTGITSSAAGANAQHSTTLGAMEASDFKSIYGAAATFDGRAIDNTAVLVKYTYYGDADFNGQVNFDDYVRTDSGFNNHRTGWVNGDFDGNSAVNFDDYVLIDLAFNTQSGTLRHGSQGAPARQLTNAS